ncbi:MAG: metal-dependent hydrolase [Symbiobacteriaceae bacterium]|nr:MAG: hypothetical protein DIU55_14625 [Bacillota bacterium]
MDSVTHVLMGHAMGALAAAVAPEAGPAVYWAALLGNSLPDVDVPLSLLLRRGIQLHRTYTHTLAGAAALSATAAGLLAAAFPGAGPGQLFLWTLLGCLAHLAVDGLNLFGVRPFWPLSGRPVELGVLSLTDPWLLLVLGVPALGAKAGWLSARWVGTSFLAMWVYVAQRLRTAHRLHRELRAAGHRRARVVPWFSGWRYVAETAEAVEVGRWWRGRRVLLESFAKQDDPRIAATLADPRVSRFLQEAEYPVALVQDGEVVWSDALLRLRADFRPLRIPVRLGA